MRPKVAGKSFAREASDRRGYPPSMNEAIVLDNAALECLGLSGKLLDYARAFASNESAAKLRLPDAVLAMGWFYVGRRGVDRDIPLAQRWCRHSARDGEP